MREKGFAVHRISFIVEKTFAVFASFALNVLKKAIAQNIHKETFHDLLKISKNCKGFVRRTICCVQQLVFVNYAGIILAKHNICSGKHNAFFQHS